MMTALLVVAVLRMSVRSPVNSDATDGTVPCGWRVSGTKRCAAPSTGAAAGDGATTSGPDVAASTAVIASVAARRYWYACVLREGRLACAVQRGDEKGGTVAHAVVPVASPDPLTHSPQQCRSRG